MTRRGSHVRLTSDKVALPAIHVFNIGTSESINHRKKRLNQGGIIAWGRGGAAVDVIMRGQSIGVHNQVKFLLGEDHIERLDPKVAADEFSLDGINKTDDLIAKAAHHSRVFVPTFKSRFMSHIASKYEPLYR
jgi:hypothetical protein